MEAKYIYMEDPEKTGIKEIVHIEMNGKVLQVPFYGVIIRSNLDVECLKDVVNEGKLKNTQVVAYNLGDAESFKNRIEKTLFEFTGEKLSHRPFSQFILTIDPVGEYFQHDVKSEIEKLMTILDLPEIVKKIFNTDGYERKRLIKKLYENEGVLSGIVEWYLKKAISLKAEISIPPCIPIQGLKTLEYAIKTNRLALTIQQDNAWQKAVYFPLDFKAFANTDIIGNILNFIRLHKPKIFIFKVFNANFFSAEAVKERLVLQKFLEELYIYRKEEKALTFSLNTDMIGLHYLAQNLCGFIEPIDGNYNPDMRMRKKKVDLEEEEKPFMRNGRYPDPLRLEERDFETLKILYENTGQPYPCSCFECKKYSRLVEDPTVHNRIRRRHRVYIRDNFVSELLTSMATNNVRGAMFDRLSEENSKLGVFKPLYS